MAGSRMAAKGRKGGAVAAGGLRSLPTVSPVSRHPPHSAHNGRVSELNTINRPRNRSRPPWNGTRALLCVRFASKLLSFLFTNCQRLRVKSA